MTIAPSNSRFRPLQNPKSKIQNRTLFAVLITAGLLMGVAEPVIGQMRLAQAEESSEVGAIAPFTIEGTLDENSDVLEDDGSYYNVHTFEGQAGQTVAIELVSDDFDTYLLFQSPDGTLLSQDDDGAGGTNSRILLSLPTTGTYTILANTYAAGETGRYTLSLQPASSQEVTAAEQLAEAEQLGQQVTQLYQQGRYADAIPLAQRVLEILETALDENHPLVATSLNNLAELYRAQGNYAAAEPLYQRSLSIVETALGDTHPYFALSLNNLASVYRAQGNYAAAEPLYRRSLSIYETALDNTHPNVALSLNNLALLYQEQGNYAAAEPLYQRSLSILETALGENHPDFALSLNNLAELYRAQGNYAAAEPLYQRSLSIFETVLGDTHPNVALSLNNLAELYRTQGNYAAAEPLYQRSLSIRETALGENHPDVANSLNNLAGLYRAQGNYAAAEPLLRRSLSIVETALGDTHPYFALSLNNLAELYRAQGNYAAAEPLYRRSLSIYETALDNTHPNVALSLNNLALLYQEQGNYAAAEPLYQRSLSILETALGENHPDFALSLNNLAELYRAQGNYAAAEPLYQRSLAISETALGETHPDVALSLNNLALLYQAQGNYAAAEPLYQRSLAISETALGETHPLVATSLNNLAVLYRNQNDLPQAIEFLRSGLTVEETNLASTLAIGSEARKRAYVRTIAGTTDAAISLHQQAAATDPDAARLALTTAFRRKGRILDAVTDSFQRLRQNLSPDEQSLLDDYTAIQTQLATLLYSGLGDQDPDAYRAQVDTLRQESERLENELARRSAEFRVEAAPIEIETVQALIPEGAVLVELVRYRPVDPQASQSERFGDPRYAAYTLDASGTIQSVDLGDAATIDQAVDDFLIALQNPARLQRTRQTARQLDQLVMQPIRQLIGDTPHLLLSPDGQLNLIPFAALVDETDQYLVETYQITYLTSGRDLLKLQLDAPSRQAPVIVANPDFDAADGQASLAAAGVIPPSPPLQGGNRSLLAQAEGQSPPYQEGNRNQSPPYQGGFRGIEPLTASDTRRSSDLTDLQFGPLPGTEREAQAIVPLLPDATLLTETQATENLLKQLDAPSILHIATHGFFLQDVHFLLPLLEGDRGIALDYFDNPNAQRTDRPVNNENPLLRSGLALAGFNPRQSGDEDGVLTALEASRLNLYGTELVVLSACETGVGSVANGEGVYGLRRAFVIAGADSLLMSLWKVSDQGTADLMTRYYQRLLDGEGRSDALRATQLEMLQTPGYEHPFYWASFIFSGDWRSLEDRE
ncbi:MAG: tetratricopeptide repeat protein [Elainellaceae cyanobacterium]